MELICAVAVAAIMISVLFRTFTTGFSILKVTREDLRATQILLQKTEAFRLFTWPELTNCPTSFTEYYYPAGTTNGSAGTLYYGTINPIGTATNIPDTAPYKANVHLITITVSWTNDFSGHQVGHTRMMQTMNAFGGMESYLIGKY
ncbi:MAG: hypothetical protein JF609_03595 [Verrucomicrobia bacterium]|nr:hypothetical protein [Verrucomicrobiota bacterium]